MHFCSENGLHTGTGVGDEIPEEDANSHREEDPKGEEAVEEAEGFESGDFGCVGLGLLFRVGLGGRGDGEFGFGAGEDGDGVGGVVFHVDGFRAGGFCLGKCIWERNVA